MATLSSILAWRIPRRGAWWATVHGVTKSQTRLTHIHTEVTVDPVHSHFQLKGSGSQCQIRRGHEESHLLIVSIPRHNV